MEADNWGSKSFQKNSREREKLFEIENRRRGVIHDPVNLGPLLPEKPPIQEVHYQRNTHSNMFPPPVETELPFSET